MGTKCVLAVASIVNNDLVPNDKQSVPNPIMTHFSDEYISQLEDLRFSLFLVLIMTVVSLYLLIYL